MASTTADNDTTINGTDNDRSLWHATDNDSADDQALARKLKQLFSQAMQQRKPLVDQWRKNHRILRNRTWVNNRADWAPSPEVPEIYPITASRVGWMTDQRPEIEITPAIQPNSPLADTYSAVGWDLQTCLQAIWKAQSFQSEIEQTLWDGHVYGIGFLKSCWDESLDGGLGNVNMTRIDPFTLYVDPQATSLDDANYIIEARTIPLQEADRRWPGAASILANYTYVENLDEAPRRTDQGSSGPPKANPGAISPNTSMRYGLPGQSRLSAPDTYRDRGVSLFECWIREHTIDDDDLIDQWRVIVMAGNKILMNETAQDLYGMSRHPYSRFVPEDMGELYSTSFVELLIPSQLAINRLLAALQLNIELSGNPVLLESQRGGTGRTKWTNRPGQRIPYNDGSAPPAWLSPPQINPQMVDLIQFYITEMERVSGISAVIRGQVPTGRASGDVIDEIQDAAFVRVRMALRQLEYTLRDQAQIQCSLITEFYDEPRMVAAVGPTGQNSSLFLRARHFLVPTVGGKGGEVEPLEYLLNVDVGSESSNSASQRRADAVQLFAMGALDAQAILETFNWPNRDLILQRLQAQAAAGIQPPGARQRSKRTS